MLANEIAFGESFQANIHYNLYGNKSEPNPHKCSWHVSKNMFTDDLDAAGKIMEATASSSRATKPAYHFSIDWDRSEEPQLNQDKCVEAADKVLEKMGLSSHQALYFWHVDANHPHMHVVVNRVDDSTGKAWDMWKSKEKLERATHEVAQEMEFLQVPGKHNEMDYSPDKTKEATRSRSERATSEDLKPWSKEQIPDIKAEIGNAFYHAESWQELTSTLSEAGYELRPKGQGYIITDGHNYTQLSKMGKQVRMDALEEKFGEKLAAFDDKEPLKPKHEYSPVESFDNLPEKIEKQIRQEVEKWENLPEVKNTATDTRVNELMAVINSLKQFDENWQSQKSARTLYASEGNARKRESQLERAEELVKYHEEKSMELIFNVDSKLLDNKETDISDKLRAAMDHIRKSRQPKSKIRKLLDLTKKKKQRLAEAKRQEKKAQKMEWALFYRMQKIREAEGRLTNRKIELDEANSKATALRKAHLHNSETREQLFTRKKHLVENMPKDAIVSADIPWEKKKTLFAVWFSEHGHTAEFLKNREKDQNMERDPFEE